MDKVNLKVKFARIESGLTQKQFREKLLSDFSIGISPSTIVTIEKGDFSNLKYATMKAIASVLNQDPRKLFFTD